MIKMMCAGLLALVCMLQAPAYAGDVFEIKILVFLSGGSDRDIYYEPPNNIIRAKGGSYAQPLKVVLKNITSNTQPLIIDEATKGFCLIAFEINDEDGNNNVVTKKIAVDQTTSEGYKYISPGKTKEFEIRLTEGEWENAFKLVKLGAAKLRARASYRNGSTVIYSEYYTILLE